MYTPTHFNESRAEVLQALIASHRLATIVEAVDGELVANHIPLIYDASRKVLQGHVARANPLWKTAHAQRVLAIFQGPQTYITPAWYPSKQVHGKVVPTWNYCVVHAHGTLTAIEDAAWLMPHLHEMTNANEATQPTPWAVDDAPAEFVEATMRGIVGIEIAISRMEGKWKVSQNKPAAERGGVVAGLRGAAQPDALQMAAIIAQHG